MIYLFFGEDTYRSRHTLKEFLKALSEKAKGAVEKIWFTAEDFSEDSFYNLTRSRNLLAVKIIAVFDNIFSDGLLSFKPLKGVLSDCASSDNIFIFLERTLKAEDLALLKEYSFRIKHFEPLSGARLDTWLKQRAGELEFSLNSFVVGELIDQFGSDLWALDAELQKMSLAGDTGQSYFFRREKGMNPFQLTDAFAKKDLKSAFSILNAAVLKGVSPDEIFWKLVWQVKNLLMVKKCESLSCGEVAKLTGLHPFVAKKCLFSSGNFKEEELKQYSRCLLDLWHDSKKRTADMQMGLEKLFLEVVGT